MPPGQGGSTSGNVDGATVATRRRRCYSRRSIEKMSPANAEFQRQVAAFAAKQEEERARQMYALLVLTYWNASREVSDEDDYYQKQKSDSDFLEGTFLKISSDKQKATRNKKNNKNKKKKRSKSKTVGPGTTNAFSPGPSPAGTKGGGSICCSVLAQSHASEMLSELHTKPSSTCVNAASGEALPFSSSNVAIDLPLLEYSSSSSSTSPVTELINPVSSATSSGKELSSSSDFRSFISTSYYSVASSSVNDSSTGSNASVTDSYTASNAWNNTMGDDAGSLSDARSEWSRSATTGLTNSRGFNKWGDDNRNMPNDHKNLSVTISRPRSSSQEGLLCSENTSHGGEFQKVISRKTAQKMKRIQRLRRSNTSPTMAASVPISSALVPRAPSQTKIGHYMKDDCFGRKPNHKKGKYEKGPSSGRVPKAASFIDEGENVLSNSKMLLITVHPGNLGSSSQMALNSTSHHHASPEVIEESCSSGCLSLQGELKALAPVDGAAKDSTESIAAFSGKNWSLDHRVNSSCFDWEEQKKEEKEQALISHHESGLDKIMKAVNSSCEIQAASDMYMTCGHPVADIETFLQSTTPVIGQMPRTATSNSCCLQGHQPIGNQPYRNHMPSDSLRSVWKWYEAPECFGIEVKVQRSFVSSSTSGTYSRPRICAYFVPYLSAVQLFGQSSFSTSQNHGGLLFEYFEWEKPFLRPPLFTKIKQLVAGVNLSGNPIFGDPKQLESVKLSDLHPASWFCVAWYPICQIPSTAGSSQAAFLTYHSLGELVPQTCSTADMVDGLTPIVCRIVGLLSYKTERDKWFQLGERPGSRPTSGGSLETDPAELLNERLRALKHCASAMSKAVVPRATGEAMNYHSDYEFFWSRAL